MTRELSNCAAVDADWGDPCLAQPSAKVASRVCIKRDRQSRVAKRRQIIRECLDECRKRARVHAPRPCWRNYLRIGHVCSPLDVQQQGDSSYAECQELLASAT